MSLSIDGLVSGLDTSGLIAQLLRAEAAPQTKLKTRLTAVQTAATAYRTVNTAFAAARSAADALSAEALSSARKVTPTDPSVTASATAKAEPGSQVTFTVTSLATTQTQASSGIWTSPTDLWSAQDASASLEVRDKDGLAVATIAIPDGTTLEGVAKLVNDSGSGLRATIISPEAGKHQLLLTSTGSGTAGIRSLHGTDGNGAVVASSFFETGAAGDATLDLGGGLTATSSTNTFKDLITGVSVTVSKADLSTPVTIAVTNDPEGVATKMQALVDAVNSALASVKTHTSNAPGSTAVLRGDSSLTGLAGRLLNAVSSAVGTDGSPGQIGVQLTRDGKVTFDKAAFTKAITDNPELVTRIVGGTPASNGPDGVVGGGDDVAAVPGLATRIFDVAKAASDSTTGSIGALAKGKDATAKDLEGRIGAWDLRLALRKQTLTRQFTAMETALSSLRSQSTWLAGQLNALSS